MWICLLLAAVTLLVYSQVRHFDFVNYDDPQYVGKNLHIQGGLTAGGLAWAFTSFEAANWFPLTWITHMADYQFFGMESGWHHLTNVWLHTLSALLLFAVLKRMTGARWPSALVAFLFALHPLHVESVAWVAERKDVLSAVFWFLTLWFYARYVERPGAGRYLAVVLAFCLGLMAKPMIVTLPFVLLLLDVWPLGRVPRPLRWNAASSKLLLEKLPLFALAAGASVLTFLAQRYGGAVAPLAGIPLPLRLENGLVSYLVYIRDMFWPAGSRGASIPIPAPCRFWQVAAAGLVAGRNLARGGAPVSRAAVPCRGMVLVSRDAGAGDRAGSGGRAGARGPVHLRAGDRALDHAGLGRGGTGGALAARPEGGRRRGSWRPARPAWPSPGSSFNTGPIPRRCFATRWTSPAATSSRTQPRGVLPGAEAQRSGAPGGSRSGAHRSRLPRGAPQPGPGARALERSADAETEYRRALELQPEGNQIYLAHAGLGAALAAQHRTAEALPELTLAARLNPDSAEAHFNLGTALAALGRNQDAASEFAARRPPGALRCRSALPAGRHLERRGASHEAAGEYAAVAQLQPGDPVAQYNLAVALARAGSLDEAIAHFTEALRLKPDFAAARQDLAMAVRQRNASAKR